MLKRQLITALLLLAFMAGCRAVDQPPGNPSGEQEGRLRTVSLQLNWFPEAEHGGYYAALLSGYYEEEGLNVEILPGGPGAGVIQKTAEQQVTFAVANADQVLLGREQQAEVVALMAPLQSSPRCIMVHADSDIEDFSGLKGMTVAMGSGKAYAQFMEKQGLLEGVQVVAYSGSVARFLERKDFAQQGYVFSEPFVAQQQGASTRNLMVSDLGFNPYTSILVTSNQQLEKDRDLVHRMVRASIRGWQQYLEDPAAVNEHIHSVNEQMSLEILDFGVEQLKPLCLPEGMPAGELGQMTAERWDTLAGQLRSIDLLGESVRASDAYYLGGLPAPQQD